MKFFFNTIKINLYKKDTSTTFMFRTKKIGTSRPQEYVCYITQEIMQEPVTLSSGNSYEYLAAVIWLRSNNTDPITAEKLTNKTIIPNPDLKKVINDWKIRSKPSLFHEPKILAAQRIADEQWQSSLRKR
jgi:hypothetical protein